MKLGIITDTHLGVRNDRDIFVSQTEKFLQDQFFPTLEAEGIRHVLHLGDFFDRRKYVNFKTLYNAKRIFFEPAKELGLTIDLTIGNHDMYNKNTNMINSPMLLLSEYDNVTIHTSPIEKTFGEVKFLLMPWICVDTFEESIDLIQKSNARVLAGHLELQGFEQYKGRVADTGFSPEMFSGFEHVFSGHYHHKSTQGNIYYLGSPGQFTWNDYGDERGFHIFDTETMELTFIKNKIQMFKKLYYNDIIEQKITGDVEDIVTFKDLENSFVKLVVVNKTDDYLFSMIQEKIESANISDLSIEDGTIFNVDDEEILEDVEDIMTVLQKYVLHLDSGVDKKQLEKFIKTLYDEALSVE